MKTPLFLADLCFRYTRDELTAREKTALEVWRKDFPRNEELFQLLTDPELMRLASIDIEKSREIVSQLIREKLPAFWSKPGHRRRTVFTFRFGRAVAIFFILLMGAGIYTYFFGRNRIHPGSYDANLVGPDGVAYALDEFHRGFMQGLSGVKIRTDDNGNDIYITPNESNASKDKYLVLSTPRGSYFSILLPDSSRVYLNAESSLNYPANFHQDTIRLFLRGEAFFEVKRDSSHPMLISVKPKDLELLVSNGRFNVMNYPYEPVDVAVVEGSSKILPYSKAESVSNISAGDNARIMNGALSVTRSAETKEMTAWQKGRFLYTKRRLEDILPAIARWYDVEIVSPGKIPQREYNLDLPRDAEISEVIEALQKQGAHVSITNRTIFVGP